MTEQEMWTAYIKAHPSSKDATYEAWCYGSDTPNLLAELTVSGKKTSTASAYPFYEYEKCDLPKEGQYNIILKTNKEAICIIKTTRVSLVPFIQVSASHAYNEGEGDRSLEYWRTVHKQAFTEELAEINMTFSEDMLVVCEEFEVVYPPKNNDL